jgi:hypothetical protein
MSKSTRSAEVCPNKIILLKDGTWLFWCLGCKKYHHLDHRWKFNGDLIRPTFHPNIRFTQGLLICVSQIANGKIRYLSETTHRYRKLELDLPEAWPL